MSTLGFAESPKALLRSIQNASGRVQCPLLALDPDPAPILALPGPVPGVLELVLVPVPVLMLGAVPLAVAGAPVFVAPMPAVPAPMLPDISLPLGSVAPAMAGLLAVWLEPPQPDTQQPSEPQNCDEIEADGHRSESLIELVTVDAQGNEVPASLAGTVCNWRSFPSELTKIDGLRLRLALQECAGHPGPAEAMRRAQLGFSRRSGETCSRVATTKTSPAVMVASSVSARHRGKSMTGTAAARASSWPTPRDTHLLPILAVSRLPKSTSATRALWRCHAQSGGSCARIGMRRIHLLGARRDRAPGIHGAPSLSGSRASLRRGRSRLAQRPARRQIAG